MKKFKILHSQNGWEYTGEYIVECEESAVKKELDRFHYLLLVDDKIKIIFDDDFEIEELID